MSTIHFKDFQIDIVQDDFPLNPREEFDNFGTMVCFHHNYNLGDKHSYNKDNYSSWQELLSAIEKNEGAIISLPVFMYDHSGITIKTSPFSCRWDSGQIGFIYITKEKARKEFNVKKLSKKIIQKCINNLVAEVSTYDDYLTGNVYGFKVKDNNGEQIHSCYGYFGNPETSGCIDEAKNVVDYHIQSERKKHFETLKNWIKSNVNFQYRKPCLV